MIDEKSAFQIWLSAYRNNYGETGLFTDPETIARQAWQAALNYCERETHGMNDQQAREAVSENRRVECSKSQYEGHIRMALIDFEARAKDLDLKDRAAFIRSEISRLDKEHGYIERGPHELPMPGSL